MSYIIAIDGRAASGKTYLAGKLAEMFNAEVIHMDDFFLPLEKRTEERLAEPGGNVDYERFKEEVIPNLRSGKAFTHRFFNCETKDFDSDPVETKAAEVIIVEGSYSHHPYFGDYADLKIFKDISPELQWMRILQRNGAEWGQHFKDKWIPLEESYFNAYNIRGNADFRICDKD